MHILVCAGPRRAAVYVHTKQLHVSCGTVLDWTVQISSSAAVSAFQCWKQPFD